VERKAGRFYLVAFLIVSWTFIGSAPRSVGAAGEVAPVHRVPSGFITEWLICGPFPAGNTAALGRTGREGRPAGLDTDYLADHGGEAKIVPAAGMRHRTPDGRTVEWRPVAARSDYVDFASEFTPNENVVAYAACRLESDADRDVVLSIGSDDSVKVWIDGRPVLERRVARAAAPDQDIVPLRLSKGVHRCLVKVEQGKREWGFYLRVQSPAGAAAVARAGFAERADLRTSPTLGQPGDLVSAWVFDPQRARLFDIAYPVRYAVSDFAGNRIALISAKTDAPAVFQTRTWRPGGYLVTAEVEAPGSTTIRLERYIYLGDFARAVERFVREALVGVKGRSRAAMTLAYCVGRLERLREAGGEALERSSQEVIEYLGWLEEFRRSRRADDVFRDRKGSHVRGYRSAIDDTSQYYSIYVPSCYERGDPAPLVVSLHGFDVSNAPYEAQNRLVGAKMRSLAERYGWVILQPFGRGNLCYRGIGGDDVFRAIEEVCRDYDIDRDRIYLMGYSMGGEGVWRLGTFFADRFAAIAPIYGCTDYSLFLDPGVRSTLGVRERFVVERYSPLYSLENLLNTPVFVNHGDSDDIVGVEHSRAAVRRLERLGYEVRYWEHPGKGHGGLDVEGALFRWFERWRRPAAPSHVRLKTGWLKRARMDWLAVERFEQLLEFATVDARIAPGNLVSIESRNASVLTLSPPEDLVDPKRPLDVVWNGREAEVEKVGPRCWRLVSPTTPRRLLTAPLRKTARLEGPMEDVWTSPFLVVQGTGARSDLMQAAVEAETRAIADRWFYRQHCVPRVKRDTDVTDRDIADYNLVIVGGPEENYIARLIFPDLPVKVSRGSIEFFGEKFTGDNLGLAMIYPNPRRPDRYIKLLVATSPAELLGLNALCSELFDFCIVDGRTISEGFIPRTMLAAGFFDQQWEWRPQYVLFGDKEARDGIGLARVGPVYPDVAHAPDNLFLSDLMPTRRWGTFCSMEFDRSAFGDRLRLGPRRRFRRNTWRKGIASRVRLGLNRVEYDLDGRYKKFRAVVGLQLPSGAELTPVERRNTRVTFRVLGDGEELWRSPPIRPGAPPLRVEVEIGGVKRLGLEVENAVPWYFKAGSADWCDARVER